MRSQNSHPKWWQLYLTFPLLIMLFALDHRLKISTSEHQAVQIGIILLVYGLIYWWIKANSRAISRIDQQYYGKFRVVQIPPLQFSEKNEESRLLQLPDSEIKGVLSDTFEMDCIDAPSLPVNEVSQELKKE